MKHNRYPGINPHLNSYIQTKRGWKTFHFRYLSDIGDLLETALPDAYYVSDEESLQTATYITGYGTSAKQQRISTAAIPGAERSNLTPILGLVEEEYINSIVIYHLAEGEFPGKAVTRIELLSPANKPPGSHHAQYVSTREATLRSGLNLVEIDYLHQQKPILSRIPSYPDQDTYATAYSIIVSDPHHSVAEGLMKVYGFGVLDPIPVIDIPLEDDDIVRVDFGAAYDQTFQGTRLFREILTDYSQPPLDFDAYTPEDQQKIRHHMAQIAQG